MRIWKLLPAVLLLWAAPLAAQATISPGMTEEQVRSAFGAPATARASGEWAYWYYHNGCPRRCGSDDVVFFREGRVVAAVLRTGARRFAGPRAIEALEGTAELRREDAGEAEEEPRVVRGRSSERARVGGVRVDAPGQPPVVIEPTEAEAPGRTVIIRREEPAGLPTAGAVGRARADTVAAPPATQVDDARRARESRVEPNTVRPTVSPDTLNKDQRAREKRVEPRVVPRP